jgi:hypothetical protein
VVGELAQIALRLAPAAPKSSIIDSCGVPWNHRSSKIGVTILSLFKISRERTSLATISWLYCFGGTIKTSLSLALDEVDDISIILLHPL